MSPSTGTTDHCGLWPVEQCPSIFSYLPPTLSIFSLPAIEDLFLLPLSIFSWVFPFFSSLPVLEWRSFWASYPPPFSLGDLTSLSFALLSILLYMFCTDDLWNWEFTQCGISPRRLWITGKNKDGSDRKSIWRNIWAISVLRVMTGTWRRTGW